MSHYYQPDNPTDVQDAAIVDWIDALSGFSQGAIELACSDYIKDQPRRRPTPGDIYGRAREAGRGGSMKDARGRRDDLSRDELFLLDSKVLPTARRWLSIPGMADHGRMTLEFWGEK